jgi:predicted amidohydrolase YtcJ
MNPFLQIQGMVLYPLAEERLTVYQALRAYTANGAYATFEEEERGTLSVGKLADFAVLDRDPFLADPETLMETTAVQTFLAGKPARPMNLGTAAFLLKGLLARKKF